MASPVFVGLPRRMLQMSIDGHDVQAMEGTTILDACRQAHALHPRDAHARQRLPRVRRRGGGIARAGAGVLTQGRSGHEDPDGLGARAPQPPARAGAARVVGRHVAVRTGGERLDGAVRRTAAALRAGGRHRGPAREGRQRALCARLLALHPLLQMRRSLRRRRAEHVRHRRRWSRLRCPHLYRVHGGAPRIGVRLLRELHRGRTTCGRRARGTRSGSR